MEKQHVVISIVSNIKQQGEEDTIERAYEGVKTLKNGYTYIRYSDINTGKVTLKFKENESIVTILYEKHLTKRMVFNQKEKTDLIYHLPQNNLKLTVSTRHLEIKISEKKVVIYIDYVLGQEQSIFGEYRLMLTITSCE